MSCFLQALLRANNLDVIIVLLQPGDADLGGCGQLQLGQATTLGP